MERRDLFLSGLCSLVGATLAMVLLLSWQASADQNDQTDDVPRLIPYEGTLSRDGAPVTATGINALWLRFDLYDGDSADAPQVYQQNLQVEVFGGRFLAMLGPTGADGVSLEEIVAAADDLRLRITVLNDPEDPADDVALAGSQRLLVSPFALWASRSSDFTITQDLDIGGNLQVDGPLDIDGELSGSSLVSEGSLQVSSGGATAGSLSVGGDASFDQGINLLNSGDLRGGLYGGSAGVQVNDTLQLGGTIVNTTGDVLFNDNLTLTGSLYNPNTSTVTFDESLTLSGSIRNTTGSITLDDDVTVSYIAHTTQASSIDINDKLSIEQDLYVDSSSVIYGTLLLAQRSSSSLTQNGTSYVNCSNGTQAISCGTKKDIVGDSDFIGCNVDSTGSRCRFTWDVNGTADDVTGYCYCLDEN